MTGTLFISVIKNQDPEGCVGPCVPLVGRASFHTTLPFFVYQRLVERNVAAIVLKGEETAAVYTCSGMYGRKIGTS